MFARHLLVIDLSSDEYKYVNRYIGNSWKLNISHGVRTRIEKIFGANLPRSILLRRKTPHELLQLVLTKIKQHDIKVDISDEKLKLALAYQISKKESGRVKVDEDLTVELVLKW